jgi:Holliday junction resolvasome RuvABC endonuclease subunit
MRILAIDLALSATGWALLVGEKVIGTGVIETGADWPLGVRYLWLFNFLHDEFKAKTTDVVLVESGKWLRGSTKTSYQTMEVMLGAWAICQATLAMSNIEKGQEKTELIRLDPGYAKRAISGDSRATKVAVRTSLEAQGYKVDGLSDHETDAISMGVSWWRNEGRYR